MGKQGKCKKPSGRGGKEGKTKAKKKTGKPGAGKPGQRGKQKSHGASVLDGEGGPRAQLRKQIIEGGKRTKRKQGGQDARDETILRMRTKVLQRQLKRTGPEQPEERRKILVELGCGFHARGMTRVACENLLEAVRLAPADEDFVVRVPLLCSLMEETRAEEASELVVGPLFSALPIISAASSKAEEEAGDEAQEREALERERARSLAATTGAYTRAVLKYIKVCVLEEHQSDPENATTEEAQLVAYLRQAKTQNPHVAEFLVFAPAFERRFPQECELPPAEDCLDEEKPVLEALEYLCRYRQLVVWTDTDEDVRRFLRHVLLESSDGEGKGATEEPPLRPLPAQSPGESLLLATWRRAREEAMDLWAGEMSEEGEDGEGEEEESGEESQNSSDAFEDAEDRLDVDK